MISNEMRRALKEREGLNQNQLDSFNIEKVLNGQDIPISYLGECGNHYEESHWQELTEKEQLLIRKWIRFMFFKAKSINRHKSSYILKHSCESDVDFYVHNDCMKKAFILEGYRARTGKINWNFNISGDTTVKKSNKFKEIFKEEIEEIDREWEIRFKKNNDKR